jgi:UrcA family protein
MKAFLLSLIIAATPLSLAAADPVSFKVPVKSADLKTEAGLAAIVARVEDGAKSMCRKAEKDLLLVAKAESTCVDDLTREAIFNSKIEPLTYFYSLKTGEAAPETVSPTLALR